MKNSKIILAVCIFNVIILNTANTQTKNSNADALYKEYLNQGVHYFEQNQLSKAKYLFLKALRLNPRETDAYINLATISIKRNNFSDAIIILEKAKSLPSKSEQDILFYNLGLSLQKSGKNIEAIKSYSKAIAINPLLGNALFSRGTLYIKEKNPDMALIDILKARTLIRESKDKVLLRECDVILLSLIKSLLNDKTVALKLLEEGSISFENKRDEEAIALFKVSALIDQNNKETYYRLGIVFIDSGNLENALDCFDKTIKLDPGNVKAYLNMGAIYGKLKKYDTALIVLNKAVLIDKNNPKVYYNIAAIYSASGKNKKALHYLKKAKAIALRKQDKQLLQMIDKMHETL